MLTVHHAAIVNTEHSKLPVGGSVLTTNLSTAISGSD